MTSSQAILALLTSVAVLSGCSATDTATPPAGAATARTTVAAADCGDAATKVQEHVTSSEVRQVTVNGQCTNLTIDTALADDDTVGGKAICEAAGEVAYTGDINSVTVLSKSGAEISTGIAGASCLP
ncbi:hypothetical protein [Actinoplanes awajinensis]|uniref:DUF4333 domain-containing protein n=1 Tax=Actinoplanes awajinensis subsp. mycoplanecinus TaxID=135947 RepID=A0A124G8X5_9ACTN|nr:hypothetical protein [Actinoplanes awajinensis]KUL27296.1 hypothetical protein ADL15_35965 [Actinoplanes awajinensis subsp. mycoplanecinus]